MAENNRVNTYDIVHPELGKIYLGMRGIYKLRKIPKNVNRKCTLCSGNKKIILNKEEYLCPKCRGSSTGQHWYSYNHYEFIPYYCDSIRITPINYSRDIQTFEDGRCGSGSLKIKFTPCDYDKRGVLHYDEVSFRDISSNFIFTEEQAMQNLKDIHSYFFTDATLCKKIQRLVNKREKECIQKYVEEAKRLKEEITQFEYEL